MPAPPPLSLLGAGVGIIAVAMPPLGASIILVVMLSPSGAGIIEVTM
jgi:hypothetical protein